MIAPWMALALMCVAFAAALGAVLSRALFVMCMYILAMGALAASALTLIYGGGAVGVALLFAGIAPVALLGLILLSVRTTKAQRRARPWLSVGAAGVVAVLVLWSTAELDLAAPVEIAPAQSIATWIAPLVFVAVAAFIGLLGYGERGALQRNSMDGEL
jgi:hypothetical protein